MTEEQLEKMCDKLDKFIPSLNLFQIIGIGFGVGMVILLIVLICGL